MTSTRRVDRQPDVVVREVGMRDGLQTVETFLSTADKLQWMALAVKAGVSEIEVTSFVPAKYIAQFSDADLVAQAAAATDDLVSMAYVPNLVGAKRAMATGISKIAFSISATEAFNQANLRRSIAASLEEVKAVSALRADPGAHHARIVAALSCAFGCPLEGRVAEAALMNLVGSLVAAGADEIALADTVGYGDPALVRRIFSLVTREFGSLSISAHFHDTRGTGLANVAAALDSGISIFDASIGGLGGCPNTPRAAGNIATEDLVYMLERMGVRTGIDIEALLDTRQFVASRLPTVKMYGRVAEAGLPTGWN